MHLASLSQAAVSGLSVCKQTAGIHKCLPSSLIMVVISLKILLSLPPSPAGLFLGLGHASPPNPMG